MTAILDEHTQYADTGGRPAVNGLLYIGDVGADPVANPQTIYSDRALTTVAANPQTLDANGRTTVKLFIGGEYSLQVNDVNAVQIYQNLQAGESSLDIAIIGLINVGGGNAITADGVPTILSYVDLTQYAFTAAQVNTGAVTLDIDGLGAKAVVKNYDEPLLGGEIEADQQVFVVYSATDDNFNIVNQNLKEQLQIAEDHSDVRYQPKFGAYTVVATDQHTLIDTTTAIILSFDPAADLGDGFSVLVQNSSGFNTLLTPTSPEVIDGEGVYQLAPGSAVQVVCDGTEFYTFSIVDNLGGRIVGLGTSNSGADLDHDILVVPGSCDSDDTVPSLMHLNFNIIKRIDALWVEGTNQGGLDIGTVAVDSWYHVFAIQNPTKGFTDVLFSLSISAPTFPTDYTRKRRIGSVLTDGSANIIGYTQNGDDWLWDDPVVDFDDAAPGTSAVSRTLSVPTGLQVLWHGAGAYQVNAPTAGEEALFTPLDVNDTVPAVTNAQLAADDSDAVATASAEMRVLTNTSAQIRTRVTAGNENISAVTYGWQDKRGRLI